MIPALNAAPANNFAIPVTENIAAHKATKVAVSDVAVMSDVRVFIGCICENTAEA